MKPVFAAAVSSAVLVAAVSAAYGRPAPVAGPRPPRYGHAAVSRRTTAVSNEALTAVVKQTCGGCQVHVSDRESFQSVLNLARDTGFSMLVASAPVAC